MLTRARVLVSRCFEGRSVYKHLPDVQADEGEELDEFQEALKKLANRFDAPPSIVISRRTFFRGEQKSGEDVNTYISVLRKLASECCFDTFTDQLIRDQFICHCSDKAIKQKLLSLRDPSLSDSIRIAKSIETAIKSAKELECAHAEQVNVVQRSDDRRKTTAFSHNKVEANK
ncbi:hypothetical protein NDU88_005059, partial [Pleurodeles waltl]